MSEAAQNELIQHMAISPDDFHDCIPRIVEVADVDLAIPEDLPGRLAQATANLMVPTSLLEDCAAALISGHLILEGPPGTGKSSLARALARAFNVDLLPVTAHEDWSTFEVIGRQELRVSEDGNEQTVPVNGHFTEAVIRCAGKIPQHQDNPANLQATWLMIDELNRAHPDKAFGELFSVLGSDDLVEVTLGYQVQGNESLVTPRRFRIIATVNSIDKQFVNALSQGLRRRFTFVTLDVPPERKAGEPWGSTSSSASLASREFSLVQKAAIERASRRSGSTREELQAYIADASVTTLLRSLFELTEKVRYADDSSIYPFIPIGTAPLIDTVELFLVRSVTGGLDVAAAPQYLDWACSVKLAPLLDAGSVNRGKLGDLARSLSAPFDNATRRVILTIVADGLYYVK